MKNGLTLTTDHFLLNIALSEYSSPGIVNLIRDPRKLDMKPDAYVGTVEEVSDQCKMVKVGDRVVIERWEYGQWDYDDERIIAREVDVLVLGNESCAPGVTAIQTEEVGKKSDLILPEGVAPVDTGKYYFGKVIDTALKSKELNGEKSFKTGDSIYVMKSDYQYRLAKHTLLFRVKKDTYNQISDTVPIVLRQEVKLEVAA